MAIYAEIEKNFKNFHLKVALENEGDFLGILGASGSGKSMTLRCIAGIERPDRGKIVINGRTVFDSEKKINVRPQERRVGYLFQNYALFPNMNVQRNLACGFHGNPRERESRVQEYVERYRLQGLERQYPAQLSGGQQQRVALARMMIGEPEVILLDEPFSALDGYLKDVVQRELQEFVKGYKGDMCLVTHNRDEAYKFCNRLLLIKEGHCIASGKTRDIFEQPGSVEACRLTGCKNYSRIERLDAFHFLALDWDVKLRCAREVLPEHTHAAIRGHWMRPAQQAGENCLPLQVTQYIETTFEQQYLVRNSGAEDTAALWWMRPKESFGSDPMGKLPPYLYLPPEHLMLLK